MQFLGDFVLLCWFAILRQLGGSRAGRDASKLAAAMATVSLSRMSGATVVWPLVGKVAFGVGALSSLTTVFRVGVC